MYLLQLRFQIQGFLLILAVRLSSWAILALLLFPLYCRQACLGGQPSFDYSLARVRCLSLEHSGHARAPLLGQCQLPLAGSGLAALPLVLSGNDIRSLAKLTLGTFGTGM